MRKANFVLILSGVLAFAGFSSAQHSDRDAVLIPLQNYLKGHAAVDIEYTKKAFHSTGSMMFIRDGGYVSQSFAD